MHGLCDQGNRPCRCTEFIKPHVNRMTARLCGGVPLPGTPPKSEMDVRLWGPSAWTTLHTFSFRVAGADDGALHWERFLRAYVGLLPCPNCASHMRDYMALRPATHSNAPEWGWRLHNDVNRRLGKPAMPLGDFRQKYETGRGIHTCPVNLRRRSSKLAMPAHSCGSSSWGVLGALLCILVVLMVISRAALH